MTEIVPYPGTGSNGGIGPGLVVSSGNNILVFGDGFTVNNITIDADVGSGLDLNGGEIVPVVDNTGLVITNGTITTTTPVKIPLDLNTAILSPEYPAQNFPNALSAYSGRPLSVGFAETLTNGGTIGQYSEMKTVDLTLTGTNTQHYGLSVNTINFQGSSGRLTGELNVEKNYVVIPAGVQIATGEDYEGCILNNGTMSSWTSFIANPNNGPTGVTTGKFNGFVMQARLDNTTAGSSPAIIGFTYLDPVGAGVAPQFQQAFINSSGNATISNSGHWSDRFDKNVPTISAGCTLSAQSSDNGGQITANGSTTSCVLTFHLPFNTAMSSVMVIPSDGGSSPTYTYTTAAITISAMRANGVYQYRANGAF